MIAIRRAWLQKHPSPVATAGEFHWYPREGDRDLRAELVERAHGLEPPAILWELAPGRAVWARAFAAHAPTDGRRYVGLAVAIAEGDATPGELLAALDEPDAAPWTAELAIGEGIEAAGSSVAREAAHRIERAARFANHAAGVLLARSDDGAAPTLEATAHDDRGRVRSADACRSDSDVSGLLVDAALAVRGLVSGGQRRPPASDVRGLMARLDGVMPASVIETTRRGVWMDAAVDMDSDPDRVAALAAAALFDLQSHVGRAWWVLCELAAARELSIDDAWRDALRSPSTWLTDEELTAWAGGALPASWLAARPRPEQLGLVDMLHLWGRGRFDLCPTAGSLVERLADAVASRVLAELAEDRDAADVIAEARWYSVLPAGRRDALRDALAERVPSLAAAWPTEIRERRLEVRHG